MILAEKVSAAKGGGKFVFPIFYVLLKNKNRQTYEKMFQLLNNLAPEFQPTAFNVDFELRVIEVLAEMYPGQRIPQNY